MPRICHECQKDMLQKELMGQTIDFCPKCEGFFFDQGELEDIIHLVKLYQGLHLDEEDILSVPHAEQVRIVHCPHDKSEMQPQDIMGLTLDVCDECKGIWLDQGEIAALKMAENHIRQNLNLYIRLGE